MSVGYKCDICKKLYDGPSTQSIILTLEIPNKSLLDLEPYKPINKWVQEETSIRQDVCPWCFLIAFKYNYNL